MPRGSDERAQSNRHSPKSTPARKLQGQFCAFERSQEPGQDLLSAVREQGLEGIIGKRKDIYQPGKRSGAWIKYRVNRGQEFVIGGYFPGPHGFDSLIVGYYDGGRSEDHTSELQSLTN